LETGERGDGMQARSNRGLGAGRGATRHRGLSTLEVAGCATAALAMAILAGQYLVAPDPVQPQASPVSDAMVFIAGSGAMYQRAQADAKTYVDMLNTAGPMAQAMEGAGGMPDPVAAESVKQLFNLQAGQP
jgi:hypothetical protein